MKDNLESDQEGLVPSGKRELSTDKSDFYHRGLELIGNLKKKTRTIAFPSDCSIGKLYIHKPYMLSNFPNESECKEAQGQISIPEGLEVSLHITEEYPYGLYPLSQLKPSNLDGLLIHHTQVNDLELKHLGPLTKLRELYLIGCCKITGNRFLYLQELISLEWLFVTHSPISDEGLEHLHMLPLLDVLHLTGTKISNAGLLHLGKMGSLRSLDLSQTVINDAGLKYLGELKNLSRLNLSYTSVTEAGIIRLRKALPNCEIWKEIGLSEGSA